MSTLQTNFLWVFLWNCIYYLFAVIFIEVHEFHSEEATIEGEQTTPISMHSVNVELVLGITKISGCQ